MSAKAPGLHSTKERAEHEHQSTRAQSRAAQSGGINPALLQLALEDPMQVGPETVLALQRLAGNEAVTSLIQAKMVVGAADDPYEHEADRVADQVLAMPVSPASGLQRMQEEDEVQTAPIAGSITPLRRVAAPEEEEPLQGLRLQQEGEDEEPLQGSRVQRVEASEEEEPLQGLRLQREVEEEEPLQGSRLQREVGLEEEEPIQGSRVQREAGPEEEEPLQGSRIQRVEAPGEEEEMPVQGRRLQREAGPEEEEPLQGKRLRREGAPEEDEEPLQGRRLQREAAPSPF
jgi:hypothetical protein